MTAKRAIRLLIVPLVLSLPASLAAAEAPVTALRCGHLLDPASGRTTENAVVLVREGRIESVAAGTPLPAGAKVADLSRYYCLPGLIDSHTHVLLQPEDERGVPPVITKSQAFRVVQGVAAARRDLGAGFTTMRDLDSEGAGFADVAVRDGIEQGIVPGPRLLVAGNPLTITGGAMNNNGLNPELAVPDPAALTDSREAMVAAVRRGGKKGGGLVKGLGTGRLPCRGPVTPGAPGQLFGGGV